MNWSRLKLLYCGALPAGDGPIELRVREMATAFYRWLGGLGLELECFLWDGCWEESWGRLMPVSGCVSCAEY